MDGYQFDTLTKGLATGLSRRRVMKGLASGMVAGVAALLGRAGADAQKVTQAYCGNRVCASDPGVCRDGCVCCVFGNGNSRCMPPKDCNRSGGGIACLASQVFCDGECVTGQCCDGVANGDFCDANEQCCSGICQNHACVATVAGTCRAGQDICSDHTATCGNTACACLQTIGGDTVCGLPVICQEDCTGCENYEAQCAMASNDCCGDTKHALCYLPCYPSIGCFTGATHITLAGGSSKPIAQIAVGDRVLGQTGINTVQAVLHPTLGERRLYALNGSAFFVTASHPFLTDDGWKSIDPAATAAEHPGLPVGRLVIGDRLFARSKIPAPALALAGSAGFSEDIVAPQFDAVTLQSIVGVPADPTTQLYNLRVDGDHTYLAADLLVHNKV